MTGIYAARSAAVRLEIAGVDVTGDLSPYLESLTYTDNEDETEDSLSVVLADRDKVWLTRWLSSVAAAGASELPIKAWIERRGDRFDGLYCGSFSLTGIDVKEPGGEVTLKASSLGYDNGLRQTKNSRAWVGYTLGGVVRDIAGPAGLSVMMEAEDFRLDDHVEQTEQSDMAFLNDLCNLYGLSMKVTDGKLVIFDQSVYERRDAVDAITRGDLSYTKINLTMGKASEKYKSCRVSYTDPVTGQVISGTATDGKVMSKNDRSLNLTYKASSPEAAQRIASAMLRRANLLEKCARIEMPGNPYMVAGSMLTLSGFGPWDGSVMIASATHKVDAKGGYTTTVVTREAGR